MVGRVESQRRGLPRFQCVFVTAKTMESMISLEFLSQQYDVVLKAWAIVIPVFLVLVWVAWKMKGIFKA
jgi:hypothetical protein